MCRPAPRGRDGPPPVPRRLRHRPQAMEAPLPIGPHNTVAIARTLAPSPRRLSRAMTPARPVATTAIPGPRTVDANAAVKVDAVADKAARATPMTTPAAAMRAARRAQGLGTAHPRGAPTTATTNPPIIKKPKTSQVPRPSPAPPRATTLSRATKDRSPMAVGRATPGQRKNRRRHRRVPPRQGRGRTTIRTGRAAVAVADVVGTARNVLSVPNVPNDQPVTRSPAFAGPPG